MKSSVLRIAGLTVEACGVVFDKDGTLVDFHRVWGPRMERSANTLLEASGLGEDFLVHLYRTVGYEATTGNTLGQGPLATAPLQQLTVVVASALFQHGLAWDRACELANHCVVPAMTAAPTPEEIAPRGNVATALLKLIDAGCFVSVATTDNRAATEVMLRHLHIEDCFTSIHCGDDPGPVKPDTRVLDDIAQSQGVDLSQLIMVGDTVSDMVMARNAGVFLGVGITGGAGSDEELAAHADVLIKDISEIYPGAAA